jgi:pimeloyl-ACP methyl ester carboxylesterase
MSMIEQEPKILKLSDGRNLAYCEWGDPKGYPTFYAHGGPGSRLEAAFFHEEAKKQGFRLISTDRPGMGLSTFLSNRTLLDYSKDIVVLANHLKIDKFGVLGWSGGAAHTTVCAYTIPSRLTFNISCSGYTSFVELPGAAEMLHSKADRSSVKLAQKKSPLFQFFFYLMYISIKYFPSSYIKATKKSASGSDQKILEDDNLVKTFMINQKEAVRQKGKGVALDAAVHYQDWGFRLQDIAMKIIVFHGTGDTLVPFQYAKHLEKTIPNCVLHTMEGKGHLYPLEEQELIFQTALNELKNDTTT